MWKTNHGLKHVRLCFFLSIKPFANYKKTDLIARILYLNNSFLVPIFHLGNNLPPGKILAETSKVLGSLAETSKVKTWLTGIFLT
jgi:hypothetical protein